MVTLLVEGMNCSGCEQTVEDALSTVSGVEAATADHTNGTVTVDGDTERDELVSAIEAAGYTANT